MSINDLKVIKNESFQKDACALLEEAIELKFETVVVLGYKDGNVSIKASKWEDTVRLIGALEYAKVFLHNNQQDPT